MLPDRFLALASTAVLLAVMVLTPTTVAAQAGGCPWCVTPTTCSLVDEDAPWLWVTDACQSPEKGVR